MAPRVISVLVFGLIILHSGVESVSPLLRRFIFQSGTGGGGGFPNSPFGGGSGGSSGSSQGSYHACVPSQSNCNLQCDGGYMKGPQNCDFCVCSAAQNSGTSGHTSSSTTLSPTQAMASTTAPTTSDTSAPTTPGTTAPMTSVDACAVAKTLCASSCGDGGYLVDPSDCTFCVCKADLHTSG